MHVSRAIWVALVVLICVAPSTDAASVSLGTRLGAAPGADIVVPIVVDPAVGVHTLEFSIGYDQSIVQPTAVFSTSTVDGYSLVADLSLAGTIVVELDGGPPLVSTSAVEVAWVVFDVVGADGADTDLVWFSAVLNDGLIPATTEDGRITVLDARVLSLPDDSLGPAGSSVLVPVSVTETDGALAFDIFVRYDTRVATPVTVIKQGAAGEMSMSFYLGQPGQVNITLFGLTPLAPGAGPLVEIRFDLTGSAGESTPLFFARARTNESQIPTAADDGLLSICGLVDGDLDGLSGCDGDCDDDDATNFPGNIEFCDGRDNDCSGAADFPGELIDADTDGRPLCVDCDDDDPLDEPPPPVGPSVVADKTGSTVELSWDAAGLPGQFRLYRGSRQPAVSFIYDHACVGGPIVPPSVSDAAVPGSGTAWYYLVARVDPCGESTLGEDRTPLSPCAP